MLDLVVCVAIDKRVQASIQRALKEENGGSLPPGVVLLNVEDHLIDPSFNWTTVIERDV